ncbi:MAG: hypothetical protein IT324_10000 [Anaerolineae bacterium]|nr:hypothetical protein [Anaerolineae bacterium]
MKRHFTVRANAVWISIVVIILVFLGSAVPSSAHTGQTNPVVINLEAGFEGYFRPDRWVPLLVSVSNDGPDISGELRVTSNGTFGLSDNTYRTSIELPTGSSKQVFLYINLESGAQHVKVELANDAGIITDVTRPMRGIMGADLLYAVITESPRGTIDLKNVRSGIGEAFQVTWRLDNIPRAVDGLRALDVMLLTDVDSGNLTTEQRRAIDEWVLGGGHLIVGGGPNWQKTQAGVTNLLPIKPASTTTLTSLPSVAAFAGRPTDNLNSSTPIVVVQGQPVPGARALIEESGVPLVTRIQHGLGAVDYLAVDPGLEPYQSWANRASFWFTLFTTTEQQPSWTMGITDARNGNLAANLIKGLRLPDVFQLCGFLAIYIIVIGPLNYLILKRLGRRELAWITIPILILGYSVVAYMTGFSLRGTQATINKMALVQVWPGSNRAQVDGVIGVLAPRRAIYNLTVQNGLTLRTMESDPYSGSGPGSASSGYTIQQDAAFNAQNFPVDAGLTAAFITSGTTQITPIEGSATITLAKQSPTSTITSNVRLVGKVKNTTGMKLTDVVVVMAGRPATDSSRRELGTLEPGAEQSFDFMVDLSPGLSSPFSLGSSYKVTGGFYSGSSYYNCSGGNCNYQDRTIEDIMGKRYTRLNAYYNLGYGDTPEQQEFRRRQALLQSFITSPDPNGGRGLNVYIAGWTDTSPITVDLQGAGFTNEDTSVYIYQLPVTITPDSAPVEVSSSLLTWTPTAETSRRDVSPYNLSLQTGDRATFRYTPLPDVRLKEITGLKLVVQGSNVSQGVISLYDWTERRWVEMRVRNGTTTIQNPNRFVGPENAIEMAVETAGTGLVTYNKIDLALYGRLNSAG